jgi:hypothetical protein
VPPAAWQGPEDKKQQPKTHSPNRLTHRNTDSPEVGVALKGRGRLPRDSLHKSHVSLRAKRGNPKTSINQGLLDRHVAAR